MNNEQERQARNFLDIIRKYKGKKTLYRLNSTIDLTEPEELEE